MSAPEILFCDDAAEGAYYGLLALMSGISEELYCAGWMCGLEDALWKAATTGPMPYGQGTITQRQCDLLRLLSEEAGGWWASDKDYNTVFVPMDRWLERMSS